MASAIFTSAGGRSIPMRLLIGFVLVLAALLYFQGAHPECSMSDMIGVEWLKCLAEAD
jgi:hypothetical protein